MSFGHIAFGAPGDADQFSPNVWRGCPHTLLNDLGDGYFVRHQFLGEDPAEHLQTGGDGTEVLGYNATNGNRVFRLTTGTTDNNSAFIATRPLGKIVKNQTGGNFWFEARVALTALDDQALFVGLGELAALVDNTIVDDPSNSAQAGLIGQSLIGFVTQQNSSATNKIDFVYRKDAGSVVTVLADATNASALASDDRSDLVANTFVKLGIQYIGNSNKVRAYVNGVEVAAFEVDATVDQAKEYGGIVNIKTGTAAAESVDVDLFSAAAQVRGA